MVAVSAVQQHMLESMVSSKSPHRFKLRNSDFCQANTEEDIDSRLESAYGWQRDDRRLSRPHGSRPGCFRDIHEGRPVGKTLAYRSGTYCERVDTILFYQPAQDRDTVGKSSFQIQLHHRSASLTREIVGRCSSPTSAHASGFARGCRAMPPSRHGSGRLELRES